MSSIPSSTCIVHLFKRYHPPHPNNLQNTRNFCCLSIDFRWADWHASLMERAIKITVVAYFSEQRDMIIAWSHQINWWYAMVLETLEVYENVINQIMLIYIHMLHVTVCFLCMFVYLKIWRHFSALYMPDKLCQQET